jgi:hypothetical protein
MNLSELRVEAKICKWCEARAIDDARAHYCSDACRVSADIWARPQSPAAKAFVLVFKQDGVCTFCGLLWRDELALRILEGAERCKRAGFSLGRELLWRVGYNTGDLWHVDHIVPIHKGGVGVGPANIQVICVGCHRRKTAGENRGQK